MANALEFPTPAGASPPLGRYSHVVIAPAGRTAYVAGQLSVGGDGSVVGKDDFAAQLRQVFDNWKSVLTSLGASFADVVKFTSYLVSWENIKDFYDVRTEIFGEIYPAGIYPANTLLVVQRLVQEEFLIEIEGTVSLGD
jgi:enamine deaminase RidA (YjgF/YER057c/UK114 family)